MKIIQHKMALPRPVPPCPWEQLANIHFSGLGGGSLHMCVNRGEINTVDPPFVFPCTISI